MISTASSNTDTELLKLRSQIQQLEEENRQLRSLISIPPRIDKVKVLKEDRILIEYATASLDGEWDEASCRKRQPARPEFYAALTALVPHVSLICEAEFWQQDELNVTGVSFSYSQDNDPVMGAVLLVEQRSKVCNSVWAFSTRHKTESPLGGGDDLSNCFDKKTAEALNVVIEEARRYLKGERAQLSLLD